MPDINVDRLSLRISGMRESESRRLAELVAEGLAGSDIEARGDVQTLRVGLRSPPGSTLEKLSAQIVSELLSQLGRTQ